MKTTLITLSFLFSFMAFSQEMPEFLKEKVVYCDQNLNQEQAKALRQDLEALATYYEKTGLLKDQSGASYRAVYQQMAKGKRPDFAIDQEFKILKTLPPPVITGCYYKLLKKQEIAQLQPRHQQAAERITADYGGDINPAMVAQRIVDNLTEEDFSMAFYKIASLATFFTQAEIPAITLLLPETNEAEDEGLETITIHLNGQNQLEVNGKTSSKEEAKKKLYDFIAAKPKERSITYSAERNASYQEFLALNQLLNDLYAELTETYGEIPKNLIFKR